MQRYWLIALIVVLFLPIGLAHYASEDANTIIILDKEPPIAHEKITLNIHLNDPLGEPITNLDISHERKLHTFIVSKELDVFAHIHAEDFEQGLAGEKNGTYQLEYTFPHAGEYVVGLDYMLQGKSFFSKIPLMIAGTQISPPVHVPNSIAHFEEYEAALDIPRFPLANRPITLTYTLRKNNLPLNNLEMYLGSETHVLVVSDDLSVMKHTHAHKPGHEGHVGHIFQMYKGPTVPAQIIFPQDGTYVIFSQFKHEGKVLTFRHVIKVYKGLTFEDSVAILLTIIVLSAIILWILRASSYRIFFLTFFLAIIIFAAIIIIKYQMPVAQQPMEPAIIGNAVAIQQVAHLMNLSIQDDDGNINMTKKDLQNVAYAFSDDPIAIRHLQEVHWMLLNNEQDHILHSLDFLYEYIKTGKELPCVPHELWHIGLYLEHNEMEKVAKAIPLLDEQYEEWEISIDQKRKVFPQFYTLLDVLKEEMKEAIARLQRYDFSQDTKDLLKEIGEIGMC